MSVLGTFEPDNLIAGNGGTKVMELIVKGPVEFKRGDVIAKKTADGSPALVDSSKSDGTETPCGIICDDISLKGDEETKTTMYVKGEFSIGALRFGGSDAAETHIDYMAKIGLILRHTIKGGTK